MDEDLLSIAIVDDEESIRVALRRLCLAYGVEASTFASVEQLFEALSTNVFDCLVLDAHMPGFGGLDAQAWLQDAGIHLPAVIITGRDDEDLRARCRAAGCACLCKPIDADVLFGAIRHAVRSVPGSNGQRIAHALAAPASDLTPPRGIASA